MDLSTSEAQRANGENPKAPARARVRTILACNPCRTRKVKCDGSSPCKKCLGTGRERECVYGAHSRARPPRAVSTRPIAPMGPGLKIRPSVAGDLRFPDTSTRLDHPATNKKQEELRAGIAAFNPSTHAYQFYGPSSHFSFVQRLYQRIRRQSHQPLMLEVQPRVPEGLRQWGVERQLFTHGDEGAQLESDVFAGHMLPKELGNAFISSYFDIIHPQAPVLVEEEIRAIWQSLWAPPPHQRTINSKLDKEKSIFYMVLAIGARLLDSHRGEAVEGWAKHFYSLAGRMTDVFEESSLLGTHLLLLRAIYAMQIGRANWVYLCLGHATRSAMALGLHRSQVVAGKGPFVNRLRLTFWTIYYMERLMSLFLGRPSSLPEAHIDAPLPDDTPTHFDSRPDQYAYVRAMAVIGRVSDTVMSNYSSKSAKRVSELAEVHRLNNESAATLQELLDTIPPFLQFFAPNHQIGEGWQEVQRTNLGVTYHMTRILIFRPALIYVTFFDSLALAQESIGDLIDIKKDMELAVESATNLIDLTYDAFFNRCPSLRRDGNTVLFIVSACLTLLFEVLDSETSPTHAKEVFLVVDKGLRCLDQVHHIGSTTGRNISLDVMRIAKDALLSTEAEKRLESNIVENFAWLNDDAFEQQLHDYSGSWLHDAMGADTNNTILGAQNVFLDSTLSGASNTNRLVFDLMNEGLQFTDKTHPSADF